MQKVFLKNGSIEINVLNKFIYDLPYDKHTKKFWFAHLGNKNWFTQEIRNQLNAIYGG
tara:strand:+ start:4453 stop:4626 length:174 start_codon:yes stop_codon:yes gene_type:complete